MMEFVQQLFMPAEDKMAAQGAGVDWIKLFRRMGELRGLKTMDEYIIYSGKQSMPQSKATGNPPTPQTTVGGNGKGATGPSFGGRDFQQQAGAVARMISGDGGQRG
jgi:hypothetical protein